MDFSTLISSNLTASTTSSVTKSNRGAEDSFMDLFNSHWDALSKSMSELNKNHCECSNKVTEKSSITEITMVSISIVKTLKNPETGHDKWKSLLEELIMILMLLSEKLEDPSKKEEATSLVEMGEEMKDSPHPEATITELNIMEATLVNFT